MQVDDLYWMGNDVDGYRASVRWSIVGTHRGQWHLWDTDWPASLYVGNKSTQHPE